MVRGRLAKTANNIQARSLVARNMENMSDAAQRKEKQKWTIEKPKLVNARKLRGIFFIDPKDEEFKETIKNELKKLENPMETATLCKTRRGKHVETCSSSGTRKTKYACIVEADESTRKRLSVNSTKRS